MYELGEICLVLAFLLVEFNILFRLWTVGKTPTGYPVGNVPIGLMVLYGNAGAELFRSCGCYVLSLHAGKGYGSGTSNVVVVDGKL